MHVFTPCRQFNAPDNLGEGAHNDAEKHWGKASLAVLHIQAGISGTISPRAPPYVPNHGERRTVTIKQPLVSPHWQSGGVNNSWSTVLNAANRAKSISCTNLCHPDVSGDHL